MQQLKQALLCVLRRRHWWRLRAGHLRVCLGRWLLSLLDVVLFEAGEDRLGLLEEDGAEHQAEDQEEEEATSHGTNGDAGNLAAG